MKRIGIITGSRAEYGLLKPVMEGIRADEELELCLFVSGMHLSPEFGLTYREIEEDGFVIDEKIEMLLSSDTPVGISKSIGLGVIGFSDALKRAHPDMLVLLGDRYEVLAAAISALILRIPIAHLHGGEVTQGAVDESIRHSITKMSYLHFTSTAEYRRRVIQLGEEPERVFHVGALGVENSKKVELLSKSQLECSLNLKLEGKVAVVTYHPVTLENNTAEEQFRNLLAALEETDDLKVIFTKANADTEGRVINALIDEYVSRHLGEARAFTSLGQRRYMNLLRFCSIVIGNSSSGIIEVPSFRKPTVDIGDRQKGRLAAESVIHCGYSAQEIREAISLGLSPEFHRKCILAKNPYEKEGTTEQIVKVIKEHVTGEIRLKKSFYDITFAE